MINLYIDRKDDSTIFKSFQGIASELMNDWTLRVENYHYRICEIEFYMNTDEHSDDYTHGHDLQKESNRWYFHGSGLDITFGDGSFFGGILIRAIYNIETGDYIYGPLKIITEIFKNFSSILNSSYLFGLARDSSPGYHREKPIAAPRVGLNEKKNPDMYDRLYRFLVMPKKKHADKTKIEKAMQIQDYPPDKIKYIWG